MQYYYIHLIRTWLMRISEIYEQIVTQSGPYDVFHLILLRLTVDDLKAKILI